MPKATSLLTAGMEGEPSSSSLAMLHTFLEGSEPGTGRSHLSGSQFCHLETDRKEVFSSSHVVLHRGALGDPTSASLRAALLFIGLP